MTRGCDVCLLLNQEHGVAMNSEFWKVIVSYDQLYLGRSLVVLKRHVKSVAEMMGYEWAQLQSVMSGFERAVGAAFGAVNCNWSLLMNDGWPDTHMHLHVRPRYDQPVQFMDRTYVDPDWPKHYGRDKAFLDPDEENQVKDAIAAKLRDAWYL